MPWSCNSGKNSQKVVVKAKRWIRIWNLNLYIVDSRNYWEYIPV